ncbi:MAG TPA: FkbM family methyltransferase [Oligoflexia bacterium]|nr:FkbM family methyltransferase [Oligoflexia bacterium]HMP48143.1 FkbM family methyltransferase [Oligoflexia bacterium]
MPKLGRIAALTPRLVQVAEFIYSNLTKVKLVRSALSIILRFTIPEIKNLKSFKLALNPNDSVFSVAINFGLYERYEQRVFLELCRPGQTIVDVGANVGLYSCIAAGIVGDKGRVLSIEPHSESFIYLTKSIQINNFKNILPIQKVVGDQQKEVGFFIDEINQADGRLYATDRHKFFDRVQMDTLDSILNSINCNKIDIIKMDIQGTEGLAWNGMKQILRMNHNLSILMEFWPWGLQEMGTNPTAFFNSILEEGFEVFSINELHQKIEVIQDINSLSMSLDCSEYSGIRFSKKSHANLLLKKNSSY